MIEKLHAIPVVYLQLVIVVMIVAAVGIDIALHVHTNRRVSRFEAAQVRQPEPDPRTDQLAIARPISARGNKLVPLSVATGGRALGRGM